MKEIFWNVYFPEIELKTMNQKILKFCILCVVLKQRES